MPVLRVIILLVAVGLSCSPTATLTLQQIPTMSVPCYVEVGQISGRNDGRWLFNGEELHPNAHGQILVTKSGQYDIEFRYYEDGRVKQSKQSWTALPPRDFCSLAIATPKGEMVVELSDLTLRHSDHFQELAEDQYYDSLIFHRIVPGFVVQGGNAQETPYQRKTNRVEVKELDPEMHSDLLHYRGALAMARMPDQVNPEKRSSPDQFYIVQGTPFDESRWEQFLTDQGKEYKSYQRDRYLDLGGAPQLDGEYTVFGYLTHGYDVLDSLAATITTGENAEDPIWMIVKTVE